MKHAHLLFINHNNLGTCIDNAQVILLQYMKKPFPASFGFDFHHNKCNRIYGIIRIYSYCSKDDPTKFYLNMTTVRKQHGPAFREPLLHASRDM